MNNLSQRSNRILVTTLIIFLCLPFKVSSAQGRCEGGVEQGKVCTKSVQCRNACVGGFDTAEACQSDINCHSACVGGTHSGEMCTLDIKCRNACVGGFDAGNTCSSHIKCRDACVGGDKAGKLCTKHIDCPGGRCADIGTCSDIGQCSNVGSCSDIGRCVDEQSNELHIKLVDFSANPTTEGILLKWTTSSELASFHIWRTQIQAGQYVEPTKMTHRDVDAVIDELTGGAAYSYEDTTAQAGKTYHYGLEGIDFKGHKIFHIEFVDSATADQK